MATGVATALARLYCHFSPVTMCVRHISRRTIFRSFTVCVGSMKKSQQIVHKTELTGCSTVSLEQEHFQPLNMTRWGKSL